MPWVGGALAGDLYRPKVTALHCFYKTRLILRFRGKERHTGIARWMLAHVRAARKSTDGRRSTSL